MNTTATLEQLRQLRLRGMAHNYEQVLALPINEQPPAHQLIAQLAEHELLDRTNKKAGLLLAASKLRIKCHLGQISYEQERNLAQQTIHLLAEGSYITKAENIIITGATGCGKSYIACALGHQAAMHGSSVLDYNMNKLAEKLHYSKLDGTYHSLYKKLTSIKLLILDDFGLAPLSYESKLALLQIIEERYECKATIIAAQLPVKMWFDYINEPTLADAILDRLTVKAHRIELQGKSKRNKIQ